VNSAILVDLGKLKQTELDEKHEILKISPSTTNRVLDTYLATKRLMFPGGHCPDVGVGGFLLGGGIGWNCKVRRLFTLIYILD
jgi:FAD/FMN-containing dehydrogenase